MSVSSSTRLKSYFPLLDNDTIIAYLILHLPLLFPSTVLISSVLIFCRQKLSIEYCMKAWEHWKNPSVWKNSEANYTSRSLSIMYGLNSKPTLFVRLEKLVFMLQNSFMHEFHCPPASSLLWSQFNTSHLFYHHFLFRPLLCSLLRSPIQPVKLFE